MLVPMQGVDVFCERCGTLQPKPEAATPRSAGVLARRMLDAVGIIEVRPEATEDWLRLCLSCRGYSCPDCWNDSAGACQTCAPLPKPVVEMVAEPVVVEAAAAPAPVGPEPPTLQPQPIPFWVTQLEPLVYERPEPEPDFIYEPEADLAPEPVVLAEAAPEPEADLVAAPLPEAVPAIAAEPEPVPVIAAEPEPEPEPEILAEPEPAPEPVVVAQPEPEPEPVRPVLPRMPVLPLPPPRPANVPLLPLPMPEYPVAPQIAFAGSARSATSTATAAPAFEAHMLLAPPPELRLEALVKGLRPCPNCQLTLSARAHFCRRCGQAQAH